MNLAQKLGLAIGIFGFLASGGTQLTDVFAPFGSAAPLIVKEIVSLSGLATGIMGVILAFITGARGQVQAVVAMAKDPTSAVQGVITTATAEGKQLAASIQGPIVAAGTSAATELSKV